MQKAQASRAARAAASAGRFGPYRGSGSVRRTAAQVALHIAQRRIYNELIFDHESHAGTESCRESQPNTGEEKSAAFKMESPAKQTKEAFSLAASAGKGLNQRDPSNATSGTFPAGYGTTGGRREEWNCPVESKGDALGVLFSPALEGRLQKEAQRGTFPSAFGTLHPSNG